MLTKRQPCTMPRLRLVNKEATLCNTRIKCVNKETAVRNAKNKTCYQRDNFAQCQEWELLPKRHYCTVPKIRLVTKEKSLHMTKN